MPTVSTLFSSNCITPLCKGSQISPKASTIFLGMRVVLALESIIALCNSFIPKIRVKKKGFNFGLSVTFVGNSLASCVRSFVVWGRLITFFSNG